MELRQNEGFGKVVYDLRTEYGNLSQCELAQRANISPSTLCRIESGQRSPSYDVLIRLLGVFKELPGELLTAELMNNIYSLNDIRPLTKKEVWATLEVS